MDIYSDPFPCGSDFGCAKQATFSDEEVMLSSSHRKKRACRKKFQETKHPVYRGARRRDSGKWVCEVRVPNKNSRIWLGTFPTAEMAARAHDVAAIALHGRLARLNFADSAWRLPVPATAEAKDIQMAAAEAAEAFRPVKTGQSSDKKVPAELEKEFFMDMEDVFGMPELLANMAEGLMLPPPHCVAGDWYNDAEVGDDGDMPLWN